jgi:hypothetical protein
MHTIKVSVVEVVQVTFVRHNVIEVVVVRAGVVKTSWDVR